MSKKTKSGARYGAVIVILIVATVFWSCPMESYIPFREWDRRLEHLGLPAETLRKISHDFEMYYWGECRSHPNCEARLPYYFGTYNGSVVMASVFPTSYITSITAAGFEFRFVGVFVTFFVWNNGRIYDIHEALDLNLLTLHDIEIMYERHNRGETYWRSTLRRIAHDFGIHRFGECRRHPDCQFQMRYYLGTYNGYVVMAAPDDHSGLSFVIIDRFEFLFTGRPIFFFVWNDGRIYGIHEALELNFLTLRDIEIMHERHNRGETRRRFPL